jgi:hypothetical protein
MAILMIGSRANHITAEFHGETSDALKPKAATSQHTLRVNIIQ